jgi:radical SAM protein with 4Fe4S-binding SPASM domain
MVRYLREANVTERIWTKTNGSVLRPSLNQKLVESGLDMICISIESVTQEGYQKIAKAKINYDGLIANIADLYSRRGSCQVYIKIADSGFSHDEIEKFYSDFSPYCDKIAVEKLMGWSYSDIKDFTLGTNPDTYDGLPLVDKMVCAYPFYVMAVNSDGSVSLCGNDWAHGTVVGNVNTQSLPDIWGGEALFLFRKKMLEGRRKDIAVCSNCYYLKIVPDNIDDYRGEILRKILSMKS